MKLSPLLLKLSKFLDALALQQGIRRSLPKIYGYLDTKLPKLLVNSRDTGTVEGLITEAITKTTGIKYVTAADIAGISVLYSPIAAAAAPLVSKLLR